MALPAISGNTLLASDLYQLCQPAGQMEHGEYVLSQGCHASGDFITQWYSSQSRGATPVSASIDTALQSPTNCNSPSTAKLSQYGVQVNTTSTAATSNATVAGNLTIQY